MKKCTKCKENKDFKEFSNLTTSSDGKQYKCKRCYKDYRNKNKEKISLQKIEHYKKNKKEIIKKQIIYYEKNKAQVRKKHDEYYKKNKKEICVYKIQYYLKNKEKLQSQASKRYRENKRQYLDKKAPYNAKWRAENKEKIALTASIYQKTYPGKINAVTAIRRAAKLNATPKWLTKQQKREIQKFYIQAAEITKQTGISHHVDHIIPLQGKEVSGLHVPWNLQILPFFENVRKSNKLIP